jgi:glycosyltransferase involved in cell wall biosynthesis
MSMAHHNPTLDVSVVVPLLDEEDSLKELRQRIGEAMTGLSYEVIFMDDGSRDGSWDIIEDLHGATPGEVKGIRFARNYGKSAALQKGFEAAQGRVVFTMDADLQDDPKELPAMRQQLLDEGLDLVSGWKKERHDPLSKTIPTKLYNWATRRVSGIHLHDFNCGLKCYRWQVVKAIEVQGEMHRYIPMLSKMAGFDRIGEKVVTHHARPYGTSKFGLERFTNGLLDLMTVGFMGRFGRKPMHFFGLVGMLMFLASAGLFLAMGGYKLWALQTGQEAKNLADLSLFYVALTGMVLGAQFFLAGFLAEMVSRNDPKRTDYRVMKTLSRQ